MFVAVKSGHGAVPPWEYIPARAGSYQAGQMLNLSGGLLVPVESASTDVPPYLCMGEKTVSENGENLPVIRVSRDYIYETTLSAAATGLVPGTMLEVSAGGLEADAAGVGAFEVVRADGEAAGDTVRGRFVS